VYFRADSEGNAAPSVAPGARTIPTPATQN
jgi:hypothetical protein